MNVQLLRLAVVLGLITAVGPFAIDIYLPALPSIGKSLAASPEAVQMSLLAFFIPMGLCQLFYGPLSDIVGRRSPILAGLVLFILGCIGCALAPTIEILIACRVVQAIGACAGMVIPRAIVRDLHTGPEATQLMSQLMLVVSISPILAPLTGSLIMGVVGWRGVFGAVAVAGLLGLVLALTQLEETRPPEDRAESSWSKSLVAYWHLLRDRKFMGLTFAGAFGVSAFFVYLANSSFVLINHYGLSTTAYAMFFALNAVSFFGASQLTGWLAGRFGMTRVLQAGALGFVLSMVAAPVVMALGLAQLEVMAALLFVGYGFLGLFMPVTGVLALDDHGENAGAASALMGALHSVSGAGVMAVAGRFADGSPLPMVAGIALCSVLAFALTQLTARGMARVKNPAEPVGAPAAERHA